MLDEPTSIMNQLKKYEFHGLYMDEAHNGGTTAKTSYFKDNLNIKGPTIYTTYTYNKCLYNNDIKECNIYRFDKEDIIKCQDINKNKNYFEKKFGKDLVSKTLANLSNLGVSSEEINKTYQKFPKMKLNVT